MNDQGSIPRFAEWFNWFDGSLDDFKKELQESDALELEEMANELLFQKKHFCESRNINNYNRLAEDLEHVASLCREYADFLEGYKESCLVSDSLKQKIQSLKEQAGQVQPF